MRRAPFGAQPRSRQRVAQFVKRQRQEEQPQPAGSRHRRVPRRQRGAEQPVAGMVVRFVGRLNLKSGSTAAALQS